MAITLTILDSINAEFHMGEAETSAMLTADNSGAILTIEESESAALEAESLSAALEAEACIYVGGAGEPYSGSYEIVPKAYDEQILETAHKYLNRNITVFEVPYYETSNLSGETVYIASEVN